MLLLLEIKIKFLITAGTWSKTAENCGFSITCLENGSRDYLSTQKADLKSHKPVAGGVCAIIICTRQCCTCEP